MALAACSGGSGGDSGGSGGDSGGSTPAAWLDLNSSRGLLLYGEVLTGDMVAMDVDNGQRFRRPRADGDGPLVAADCTRNGDRVAYATVDYATNVTRLAITGKASREDTMETAGVIQGFNWAPDGGRIAMSRYDGAEVSLLTLDVATGEFTPLPGSPGPAGPPRWSPDGSKLAFSSFQSSAGEAYILEIGQAQPVQLFQRPAGALIMDWSPDGQSLLFTGPDANNQNQIYQVNADGSGERQITTSSTSKSAAIWSEDGSTIAFAATTPVPQASRFVWRLHNVAVWLVNPDGGGERPLTDVALDAWPLAWCLPGPWLDGWASE